MNDDFLYSSKPPLRPEFVEKVYARITRDGATTSGSTFALPRNETLRLVMRFILILLFIFSATVLISKDARAIISHLVQEMSGFLFEETDQFPFPDHPESDYKELPSFTLPQVREMLTFPVNLPAHVPKDYVLSEEIGIACNNTCAILTWHNEADDSLMLTIQMEENYPKWAEPVGLETVVEAQVNDEDAVLIKGAWDFESEQWVEAKGLRLKWEHGGLIYDLSWRPSNGGKDIEIKSYIDELILIAESIQ